MCLQYVIFFFTFSAFLRSDGKYLRVESVLYMSSFLATKVWKPWMEWGLNLDLIPGNLGLILCALEFSFNTVKSVWLFTCYMLLIIRKYDLVQISAWGRGCSSRRTTHGICSFTQLYLQSGFKNMLSFLVHWWWAALAVGNKLHAHLTELYYEHNYACSCIS